MMFLLYVQLNQVVLRPIYGGHVSVGVCVAYVLSSDHVQTLCATSCIVSTNNPSFCLLFHPYLVSDIQITFGLFHLFMDYEDEYLFLMRSKLESQTKEKSLLFPSYFSLPPHNF